MGDIRTGRAYASSIANNIDNSNVPEILGTIAGDDTIFIVLKEGVDREAIIQGISDIIEFQSR
jgi:transcriptional regulator of arginine metabolism